MMKTTDVIRMASIDLDSHSTTAIVCPFCGGGFARKRCMSITLKDTGILYICHRASCARSGFEPSTRTRHAVDYVKPANRSKEANPCRFHTRDLSDLEISRLINKYPALTEELILEEGIKKSYHRYIYPLYNIAGDRYGCSSRWIDDGESELIGSKSLLYFDDVTTPHLHFPSRFMYGDAIALVEDQISAIISSTFLMPTAALLGTHITQASVDLLKKHQYKLVLIALDNDAAAKSIEMAAKLKLEFPYVAPVLLKKDIKNMNHQEIESLWKNYFYPHLQKAGVLTND